MEQMSYALALQRPQFPPPAIVLSLSCAMLEVPQCPSHSRSWARLGARLAKQRLHGLVPTWKV